jgi:hypothetical protein
VEKREEPAPSLEVDGSPACAILSVRPVGEGEWVEVILSVPAGETGILCAEDQVRLEKDGGYRVDLHLTVEQYAALRPVRGGVTSEQAAALLEAGRLSAAIRRGMGLLAGSSSSQRGLESKLVTKGISRESASRAAAYLAEEGYIREADTATLRVEQGLRKGWGPRRIREDLRTKGFGPEAVALAYDKTVMKCHELKWPYCNGILKRWHEKDLHTVEEIESENRPAKRPDVPAGSGRANDDAWKYV